MNAAESGPSPEHSIVVPAYNEEQRIGACLRSLTAQDIDQTYEVILVDNNCTDGTLAIAQDWSPGMHLRIVHEARQGRGAARRTGFDSARGRVVFSADADTVYPRWWMKSLLDPLGKR